MALLQKLNALNNINLKVFVSRNKILGANQFSNSNNIEKEAEISKSKETEDEKKNDKKPKEFNGPKGPEPTRYGDWERKGRVSDF